MAEHSLRPLTALGDEAPRAATIGQVRLAENPDLALASVAARRAAALAETAQAILGDALPRPGESAGAGPVRALWTGPEQWLFEAPFQTYEDLAGTLKSAFGDAASVTEQSDAWAAFEIRGDASVEMLARLSMADAARMTGGAATRTLIEHMGCLLICRAPGRAFTLLGARSSAASLFHALTAAARAVA